MGLGKYIIVQLIAARSQMPTCTLLETGLKSVTHLALRLCKLTYEHTRGRVKGRVRAPFARQPASHFSKVIRRLCQDTDHLVLALSFDCADVLSGLLDEAWAKTVSNEPISRTLEHGEMLPHRMKVRELA